VRKNTGTGCVLRQQNLACPAFFPTPGLFQQPHRHAENRRVPFFTALAFLVQFLGFFNTPAATIYDFKNINTRHAALFVLTMAREQGWPGLSLVVAAFVSSKCAAKKRRSSCCCLADRANSFAQGLFSRRTSWIEFCLRRIHQHNAMPMGGTQCAGPQQQSQRRWPYSCSGFPPRAHRIRTGAFP